MMMLYRKRTKKRKGAIARKGSVRDPLSIACPVEHDGTMSGINYGDALFLGQSCSISSHFSPLSFS